jgi:hypothetical protein
MQIARVMAVLLLAGCAGGQFAAAPPAGIDLSGHWRLNEAESDDAQRLMQSQLAAATAAADAPSSQRRGSRGGVAPQGALGPVMPSVAVLDEGLRWPGKDLAITQANGVVSFAADGSVRDCRARSGAKDSSVQNHTRGRGDAPPPKCGWDDKTLVVESGEAEEDRPPYEQRFSLSTDGTRLIEVVTFHGGRSSGFTASRVWDRVTPANVSSASNAPETPRP